CLQSKSFPWTF
nr:immunoglobulin light chain junction region [Macaca mulatta]MOX51776.1 immunoglobulin light chain junction region [Macaca mulatta]MOX52148.1 immunoglobulin light chain junction region [Macaca mulatta]MOX52570.1 immunoglobulin light chain junction region [Macaca mulatta]MOX53001.1 immunoglobulin light chain junction region [Macaca mulatta]